MVFIVTIVKWINQQTSAQTCGPGLWCHRMAAAVLAPGRSRFATKQSSRIWVCRKLGHTPCSKPFQRGHDDFRQ